MLSKKEKTRQNTQLPIQFSTQSLADQITEIMSSARDVQGH